MSVYQTLFDQHTQQYNQLTRQYNLISLARLLLALCLGACGYAYVYLAASWGMAGMGLSLLVFVLLIQRHTTLGWQMRLQRALANLNEEEMAYLNRKKTPLTDGAAYADQTHAYAHDLDIFGKNSLFQFLNRAATYIGQKTLANLLLQTLPTEAIRQNQTAIQELRPQVSLRQTIQALGQLHNDSASLYAQLIAWAKTPTKPVPRFFLGLSYFLPLVWISLCAMAWLDPSTPWDRWAFWAFLFNFTVVFSQAKAIRKEMQAAGSIGTILKQYSHVLETIERAPFECQWLQTLQQQLKDGTATASGQVRALSHIFHELESLNNVLGALLFNGALLYHIRSWHHLTRWKAHYAPQIEAWLEVIGEVEALSSLANFAYNHEGYTFPTLNQAYQIDFQGIAHPLLSPETSVKNDIRFDNYHFIILTGSNMSGKSTFLRTLGVNMVLAGIGAPVCATQANVHPLPVWVSMRLSDSLQDSESYFFAEVKRLREIMQAIQTQPCFVLLDEILRGTNSDDKRSGTIGVIKKIIAQRVFGAIATHDIEVCHTTAEYPQLLANKCFEVEIIHDELVFDYKLRDGICQNKSATFLMKKMGIIG